MRGLRYLFFGRSAPQLIEMDEHEGARWLSECVASMHVKLMLSAGQIIDVLLKEVERQLALLSIEDGGDL